MKRWNAVLGLTLLGASLATGGCESPEAKELKALKQQYNDLQIKKEGLQKDLAECQSAKADLEVQLQTAETRLAAALKARPGVPSTPPLPPEKPEKPLPPGWERTATGDKKTLASDILFAAGKAALSPAGEAELKKVAATIKSSYASSIVQVFGYTDSDPVVKSAKLWQDNLDLSANRAMAVTRFLEKQGISADRIDTVARGETHPVAINRTAADKSRNRRVEIVVVLPR